jgi:hypothetical protein
MAGRPGGSAPAGRSSLLLELVAASEDELQDNADDEKTRRGMRDEAHPGAAEEPAGVRLVDDAVDEGVRHAPPLMQVVQGEDGPVGDPVAAPEDGPHPWQEQTAEDQLLGHR